ncbi:acetyl-CoA carboxylase biotin carboxylase subunit [Bacillus tianshenii]|uniref:acetyl-CoA carboxylase biotin carboxylase subunit n=1 Tax=Sutcliffiella tianshenii TaxID=1463404 RepID=UPI001CD4F2EC|nr:acetyl-CoA carboxylase biotin carboxylase subunit [Bacillus tianshenii]MCA1322309.1 acetyl-CoA carboxylase biotin carboxylase subunit [Bacillus tianshenii]
MQKILIANRGEIAERIIRTCNRLGIETVAVYSEADKDMPYVHSATIARHIGEAPPQKSYLNVDLLIEIAKEEKVDAVHPGYGFLSENGEFSERLQEEGLTFIGPSVDVIKLMGDKLSSRRTMIEAGVPVVPGSEQPVESLEEACRLAMEIGYPVMLKASGGGGGIGMHRCETQQDIENTYEQTKKRAKAYFKNEDMFIEKYVGNARHIEVQVFGDSQGNVVHMFERNCSVQRRNQKVIEEAQSPAISDSARMRICEAAVLAAKHVNYCNAGTVEFIMDEKENFYFLEMNTRLQVEHPITESITGLDLVEWQLLVASGNPLPLKQEEITSKGHSIEFRLYAEDPVTFFPSPGLIKKWHMPIQEGIRIDSGYGPDMKVTPFYDPMIAKIIISAQSREKAIERAKEYLDQVEVEGIKTNLPFLRHALNTDEFIQGNYHTGFIQSMKPIAN